MSDADTQHKPELEYEELGGEAVMTEADKTWIVDQITIQRQASKLERAEEFNKLLKALPCREIDRRVSKLENGKAAEEKADEVKANRRTFEISLWRLVIAGLGIILGSNISDIVKLLTKG